MKLEIALRRRRDSGRFIDGSDARVVMGPDKGALIRLLKKERREVESKSSGQARDFGSRPQDGKAQLEPGISIQPAR